METKGNIQYERKAFSSALPELVEYERYSGTYITKPLIVTVGSIGMTREYTDAFILFRDNVPVSIMGEFKPRPDDSTAFNIPNNDTVNPKVILALQQTAHKEKGRRVYIRGRRGGMAEYPGWTYTRNKYSNVRSNINVIK